MVSGLHESCKRNSIVVLLFVCRPDGRLYDGGWHQGKQHGQASYTNSAGKVRFGTWEHGKRVEWRDTEESVTEKDN